MPKTFKNEAALRDYCMELARGLGCLAWHFKSPGLRGVPDILIVFPGPYARVVWVEFKNPNGKGILSESQKERIGELRSQEAFVHTCDSLEQFEFIIATHL